MVGNRHPAVDHEVAHEMAPVPLGQLVSAPVGLSDPGGKPTKLGQTVGSERTG